MKPSDLIFQTVKESRGWYFVEYAPPICSHRFAILELVFPDPVDKRKIVPAMESELRKWLDRYPIPIMVSAFDGKGSVIHLEPVKSCSHLMGFRSKESDQTVSHWRLVKDEELPVDALDLEHLKKVYH